MYKGLISLLQNYVKSSLLFKYGFNLSPVYRRSTGRIVFVSDDLHSVRIEIPLSYRNRNYAGTMYGGSMASATDPIYMVQLIKILGKGYVVWDKATHIRFKRPGKQTMYAEFTIAKEFINQIIADIKQYNERLYVLKVQMVDIDRRVYAEIEKTMYISSKAYYQIKKKTQSR